MQKQQILFVSGKGGVGKSAVAAALALRHQREGKKTLLVELGEQSYFQHIFHKNVSYEPTQVESGLSVALWGSPSCLHEYVLHFVRVKKIVDLFFENRVMRTFVRAAPALKELAILGKITSGVRQWGPPLEFDTIVVDGFSTGHFMALLRAPVGMSELVEGGPMGAQSRGMVEVLKNKEYVQYHVVSLLEELPVSETVEFCDQLKKEIGVEPVIWANRQIIPSWSDSDMKSWLFENDDGSSEFAHYLDQIVKSQTNALSYLEDSKYFLKTIPQIFTSKSDEVILELASKVNS